MLEGIEYRVDRTKTRQAVRSYFAVYRQYKVLLDMDMEPHREPTVVKGYEKAMDPDLIRVPYSTGGSGMSLGSAMGTREDRDRKWFVENVERKVSYLPDYQRDIIRHQYMGKETPGRESKLPSDTETFDYLRRQQWYVSERYYDEEKSKAIMTLAEAFRIMQHAE